MTDVQQTIIRPVVTEKSVSAARHGKYTFRVTLAASKIEIQKAVEDQFRVKVAKVNTQRVRGKRRRVGRFREGTTERWKKAIVTLAEGHRIPFFEGM